MDRLDAMKVFVLAVDEGSLAAAGRKLGRSPAAVSRAARLVDMMEAEGLVSPITGAAGGKSREVLVKPDYFDEVDAQLR